MDYNLYKSVIDTLIPTLVKLKKKPKPKINYELFTNYWGEMLILVLRLTSGELILFYVLKSNSK